MTEQIVAQRAEEWERCVKDGALAAELAALRKDEKALSERFFKELTFGTGGLRGIVGVGTNCMNVYTVSRASRGVAAYMRAHALTKIAVSYDSRRGSRLFAETAARIFAEAGVRVVIVRELMPTPFLSYLVREEGCGMGVMITASHNPAAYNGYKVYGHTGCQITDGAAAEIAAFIARQPYFAAEPPLFASFLQSGAVAYADASLEERYLAAVRGVVGAELHGLKVAYTALNGTGYRLVPKLLRSAGAEVVPVAVQCVPDENFTTCPYPNPEKREALTLGLAAAEENGCDILVATDPDADRVGVAVRSGGTYRTLTGNEAGLLLTQYLLEERKGRGEDLSRLLIIKTIVTTRLADKIAAAYGAGVINVLTGFKYIGEQLDLLAQRGEEGRFLLGFEESYGYLLGTLVRDKDAPVAALALCKMAAAYKAQGKDLYTALQELYAVYGHMENRLFTFPFGGAEGQRQVAKLMRGLREGDKSVFCGKKVVKFTDYLHDGTGLPRSDVLSFELEGGECVIVRPSGTEPILKMYLSAYGGCEEYRRRLSALAARYGG